MKRYIRIESDGPGMPIKTEVDTPTGGEAVEILANVIIGNENMSMCVFGALALLLVDQLLTIDEILFKIESSVEALQELRESHLRKNQ